uniref:Secreted protein n=1 Tax=Trichogramma kaykai TaxID=54128 RepID=A0ABD2VZV9_9HYME
MKSSYAYIYWGLVITLYGYSHAHRSYFIVREVVQVFFKMSYLKHEYSLTISWHRYSKIQETLVERISKCIRAKERNV